MTIVNIVTIFYNNKVKTCLFNLLKGYGLEAKSCVFVKTEHEVHVLHSLAHGALQQVVDDAGDHHLVTIEFVEMDKGLVCADDLLEIECSIDIMREGSILIECLVEIHQLFFGRIGWASFRTIQFDDLGAEDTTSEVATVGHEIDRNLSFCGCIQQRIAYSRSR